jgi:hypothetical protein
MQFIHKRLRLILFITAIGNFIGILPALISPSFFNSQFFRVAPDMALTFPYLAMYHYLFWGIGFIMAIAYWMAAVDAKQNRIVLLIGGLGKLLAVAFWAMVYAQGHGKWLMLAGVCWDGPLGMILLLAFFSRRNETPVA